MSATQTSKQTTRPRFVLGGGVRMPSLDLFAPAGLSATPPEVEQLIVECERTHQAASLALAQARAADEQLSVQGTSMRALHVPG